MKIKIAGIAAMLLATAATACATGEPPRVGPHCLDGTPLVRCCINHRGVETVTRDGPVICRDKTVSQVCSCHRP